MSDTDLELLARYAGRQAEDAFAELVRRHLNLVYSAALRQVCSPQLAEEVAQSTFLDLARNASRLQPDTILTAWLYQVARRTAVDVVRRETSRQLREQIATEMNAMNATAADWAHIEPLLDEAMHGLDDTDRAAVLLRYFENKSLREVGQALGASENAAQKRLTRAIDRLREFFAKRGVTVGASGLAVVISANAVQAAPAGLAVAISTAAAAFATIATTSIATATKAIAMTTLKKSLLTAALVAALGTGIYEARRAAMFQSQVRALEQKILPLTEQMALLAGERDDIASRLSNSVARTPKPFNWASVESADYKQYIANLRAVGCPEPTIRDIVRTDLHALFEEKKKRALKGMPRFEYWKGEAFIRGGVGREAWIQLLALDDERDAALRALGIESDHDKKAAKNATFLSWALDFLGDEKKAHVLRLRKELENNLAMRAPDSLDAEGITRRWQEMEEAARRPLTPGEALQYDMTMSVAGTSLQGQLYGFDPTEQEFVSLFKLRKKYEEPLASTMAGETGAERRARHAAVESNLQSEIEQTLGQERFADYRRAREPIYQEMYRLAMSSDLGPADARRLYDIRKAVEEQTAEIRADQALTAERRGVMLTKIKDEAIVSLQTALREKGWELFNRQSGVQKKWFDTITKPTP